MDRHPFRKKLFFKKHCASSKTFLILFKLWYFTSCLRLIYVHRYELFNREIFFPLNILPWQPISLSAWNSSARNNRLVVIQNQWLQVEINPGAHLAFRGILWLRRYRSGGCFITGVLSTCSSMWPRSIKLTAEGFRPAGSCVTEIFLMTAEAQSFCFLEDAVRPEIENMRG